MERRWGMRIILEKLEKRKRKKINLAAFDGLIAEVAWIGCI